jgi:hypothetical protein
MKKSVLRGRSLLVSLPTPRLLAYRKDLLRCPNYSENVNDLTKKDFEWGENLNLVEEILLMRKSTKLGTKK